MAEGDGGSRTGRTNERSSEGQSSGQSKANIAEISTGPNKVKYKGLTYFPVQVAVVVPVVTGSLARLHATDRPLDNDKNA